MFHQYRIDHISVDNISMRISRVAYNNIKNEFGYSQILKYMYFCGGYKIIKGVDLAIVLLNV